MRYPFDGQFNQTQDWNDPKYRESYYQFGLLGHNGEDYGCPAWTPILTPHSGIIKEATLDSGYGNYIKVENENETSILAHLSKISVEINSQVQEGQLIGYSGNTGNSTGAHLHWGYYRTKTRDKDNGFNGYIDQTDWLNSEIIANSTANFTDQTIIPNELTGWQSDLEIQALRSILKDFLISKIDLQNTRLELNKIKQIIQEIYDETTK